FHPCKQPPMGDNIKMMGKTPQHTRVCSPTRKAGARKAGVLELAFSQTAGVPTLAHHE
ncbi:MAG: hypothetical protein ICV52_18930, partial [Microcoleus sp. C1-bin4]|nr:hypothetical protein [Microcoleus sp. C1-bin4]